MQRTAQHPQPDDSPQEQDGRRNPGRPRIHTNKRASQAAASKAYRDRKKARRQAPTMESSIIDLSAVAAYKVKR